jgi:chemotaxis protein methyltransferase CheR
MAFTFFFRDMHTMETLEQHVFPHLIKHRYIDIWDAGCANGPEPYTLAMLLRENTGEFGFRNIRIHATDLNGKFGEIIDCGIYTAEEVGRIPAAIMDKYFQSCSDGNGYQIIEPIRRAVTFWEHDLTSLQPIRDEFCLVVCKNVLLHLSAEQRLGVLRMFRDALRPEGFLAVEQTQKIPDELQGMFRQITPDAQVFQKT